MEKKIELINNFFSSRENIHLLEVFEYLHDKNKIIGKIKIETLKGEIYFKVDTPISYPLGEMKFYTETITGYPHQNYDGSLCLTTPLNRDLDARLLMEEERLKTWIEVYYIKATEDTFYEYPSFQQAVPAVMMFTETSVSEQPRRFTNTQFGYFQFASINNSGHLFIAKNLGNVEYGWSNQYKDSWKYEGIWVKIDKEPVIQRKEMITKWTDLFPLFPEGFESFFSKAILKLRDQKQFLKNIKCMFLMIGYEIPHESTKELHWNLLCAPVATQAKIDFSKLKKHYNEILFGRSENVSYERFFGRGKLTDALTNAKILVIGIGALGSMLCKILARGGVRDLSLCDLDTVEPGNICRGEYYLLHVGNSKMASLTAELNLISPHISISQEEIPYTDRTLESFSKIKERLNRYDYIFDCSTDMQLSYCLDEMQIERPIINLSISDKAKEFVCITSVSSITDYKKHVYDDILGYKNYTPEFREGTGCWHPTFQASYLDISALLSFSIKEINHRLETNISLRSFILKNHNNTYELDYGVAL
jgi:hypothetical protein